MLNFKKVQIVDSPNCKAKNGTFSTVESPNTLKNFTETHGINGQMLARKEYFHKQRSAKKVGHVLRADLLMLQQWQHAQMA